MNCFSFSVSSVCNWAHCTRVKPHEKTFTRSTVMSSVSVQYRRGRNHDCGLERVEGAFPVQHGHQPAGDHPLLETQHGKRRAGLGERSVGAERTSDVTHEQRTPMVGFDLFSQSFCDDASDSGLRPFSQVKNRKYQSIQGS